MSIARTWGTTPAERAQSYPCDRHLGHADVACFRGVSVRAPAGRLTSAGEIGWITQVGLSVLWTVYAALALAWGFARSSRSARYGALALLGLTVFKVFLVDLSAVRTAYRILSFLVLGIVLLLVSVLYQKARRSPEPAATAAHPGETTAV